MSSDPARVPVASFGLRAVDDDESLLLARAELKYGRPILTERAVPVEVIAGAHQDEVLVAAVEHYVTVGPDGPLFDPRPFYPGKLLPILVSHPEGLVVLDGVSRVCAARQRGDVTLRVLAMGEATPVKEER